MILGIFQAAAFGPISHLPRRPARSLAMGSMQEAVEEFRMITEEEATVRKIAGVGIGVTTAALFATSGLGYGQLSAGIFGAISTFRTGKDYQ